jgi:hypothetical protein
MNDSSIYFQEENETKEIQDSGDMLSILDGGDKIQDIGEFFT